MSGVKLNVIIIAVYQNQMNIKSKNKAFMLLKVPPPQPQEGFFKSLLLVSFGFSRQGYFVTCTITG